MTPEQVQEIIRLHGLPWAEKRLPRVIAALRRNGTIEPKGAQP